MVTGQSVRRVQLAESVGRMSELPDPAIPGIRLTHVFGHSAVGRVAGREHEYSRPALFVDNRVYLAVPAALGDANRLLRGPRFSAAGAAVRFDMSFVQRHSLRRLGRMRCPPIRFTNPLNLG
jgi:hypothetical protein